jgi:hypothetical protein
MPVARGKGTFFEALMPMDWQHTDVTMCVMDCDAAVKLIKAGAEARNHPRGWEPN